MKAQKHGIPIKNKYTVKQMSQKQETGYIPEVEVFPDAVILCSLPVLYGE